MHLYIQNESLLYYIILYYIYIIAVTFKSNLIVDKCMHSRCSRMSVVLSSLYILTLFTEELNVYYLHISFAC